MVSFNKKPTESKIAVPYLKQWMVDHCSKMLEIKIEKPDKISLRNLRLSLQQIYLL